MRTSGKPWYRKQNSTWYVQHEGKQVRLSKDKAEAKRKWLKLMAQGDQPKDRFLHECIEHYLPTLTPTTRRTREQVLNGFLEGVGKVKVSTLTPRHVTAQLKSSWSPSTQRSYIKTILACLNRAVKDGLIEENPIKN